VLVLSHFSLPLATWEQRLDAAVAGGFHGIGLYGPEYRRLLADGWTDETLRASLDERGLGVDEVLVASRWGSAEPGDDADLVAMGAAFGAAYVQAVAPLRAELHDGVRGFRRLCDQAAEGSMAVALEFLPEISAIGDVAAGLAFVEEAGRDNGGLCVDTWHFERGTRDWDDLARLPAERVVMAQLDDGPAERVDADYYVDCTRYRLLPGEGDFQLDRFFRTLAASGWDGYVSVEVMSDALAGLDPIELGRRLGESSSAVLSSSRVGRS
jgi:sugar phosphate isomerase/epimerase